MLSATPASIQHAFAQRGVPISRVASSPEICDRQSGFCMGIDAVGGGGVIYFAPRSGKDFMVVLFKRRTDALKVAELEAANTYVETAVHRSALLVYVVSSRRVARIRAALAASR